MVFCSALIVETPAMNCVPFRVAMLIGRKFDSARSGRRFAGVLAGTHDPVQYQRHEADRGVRTNALRQAGVDRPDLDFGFEHAQTASDISQ